MHGLGNLDKGGEGQSRSQKLMYIEQDSPLQPTFSLATMLEPDFTKTTNLFHDETISLKEKV